MMRLLFLAEEIINNRNFTLKMKGKEQECLLEIQQGKITDNMVIEQARQKAKQLHDKRPWPKLPNALEEQEKEMLNNWVIKERLKLLN